ncbi:pseudouridine synthase [Candidatus Thiomargarita nelsonii]|uniref:Pseudouridine synthase n=1 Tax=Candidatus Thiomargarita nelsonii TaxID=1003181 RepID=A0A0A6RLZ2_9GAMM|nr:pseudouridine synthase [Candidatus Thiomargarita nelsonii]
MPSQNTLHSTEKLQKVLARAGLASRREIERWIQNGRIQVNQHTAKIGDRVSTTDKIRVDGRQLSLQSPPQELLCYHKPAGKVCTRHDPDGRSTIFERLPSPKQGRWISVGRLDYNTAGLLLLTNNGELAHRLMHPSYNLEREYAVRILGEVDNAMLKRLHDGVLLSDGMASFKQIVDAGGSGANHWYHVILTEGRKHEVRRLWQSQGVTVSRLIRIRFGPILLPKGLRSDHYMELDSQSQKTLLQVVGLNDSPPSKKRRARPK